ncbi:MAG: FAD-binding oxidoreductase, partial [Pseudomonadota bacterium]
GVELFNSVMDVDAKVVASSMEGGLRVAGPAEVAPIDAPPSETRKAILSKVAQAAFPGLHSDNPSFWMGRRPSFPDSLPMIGHVDSQPGLYVNFGHSHYGLMMAPKSGECIGQLVCGELSNTSLSPYSPTRF